MTETIPDHLLPKIHHFWDLSYDDKGEPYRDMFPLGDESRLVGHLVDVYSAADFAYENRIGRGTLAKIELTSVTDGGDSAVYPVRTYYVVDEDGDEHVFSVNFIGAHSALIVVPMGNPRYVDYWDARVYSGDALHSDKSHDSPTGRH